MRIDKPTIADFTSANHDHSNAAGGGNIPAASVTGTAVVQARQVISGGGLTGGGDLSADRTLVVGAGTGITVNADDVAVTPVALLNGVTHNDTTNSPVTRGDLIYGNSTPAWDDLAVGTGVLAADGTDVTGWTQAPTLTTPSMTTPVVSTLLNLTAGQIQFPATQVASAGANVLDDYEEGAWTPGLAFGGGSSGMTFSGQAGRYIKVGKSVFVCGSWTLTNKGSSTGNAAITGLPFTTSGNSPSCMFLNRTANLTTITGLTGSLPINSTTVNLADYVGTVANNTHFNNNTFTDGMLAVYEASA